MEAVFTTTPRSPSSPGSVCAIAAAASRRTLKVPTRLTVTTLTNAPRSCGSALRPTVRCAQPMPAQLIAMRSGRSLPVASATASATDASSVTSVRTNVVCPPSSSASAFPRSSCRSRMVTAAPRATRARVVALPRPEAPPETTALTSKLFMPGRLSVHSTELWSIPLLHRGQQRLDPLGVGDGAHQGHVPGGDDDAVAHPHQGDQVPRVLAEDDVARGVERDHRPA